MHQITINAPNGARVDGPLHDRGNFLDACHGSTNVLIRSSLLALAGQVIE
jgi:hypothetical protein